MCVLFFYGLFLVSCTAMTLALLDGTVIQVQSWPPSMFWATQLGHPVRMVTMSCYQYLRWGGLQTTPTNQHPVSTGSGRKTLPQNMPQEPPTHTPCLILLTLHFAFYILIPVHHVWQELYSYYTIHTVNVLLILIGSCWSSRSLEHWLAVT